MKLKSALVLELTRKCNMSCKHCLRGNAQDIVMSNEIIREIISSYSKIDDLLITGGEPLLVPEKLKEILNVLKEYNVKLNHFRLVTNGSILTQEIKEILNEFNEYQEFKEMSIAISLDKYHPYTEDVINNLKYFSTLSYFDELWSENLNDDCILIDTGNAKKNDLDNKEIVQVNTFNQNNLIFDFESKTLAYQDMTDPEPFKESMIYINAKGDLLYDCNLSYDDQEKAKEINILQDNIIDYLYNKYLEK